ncbi:hypothetical protein JCM19237_1778 [Photobacterium aphoticum]|uniref:Uncharacterized protein n=1 Tax=Photobacterium aphoticum TaxID=754436 RepID=A0A090QV49_9GAMM|nr:hypothetical protein JCM19237_1778 [Photobacterium aphoticum]
MLIAGKPDPVEVFAFRQQGVEQVVKNVAHISLSVMEGRSHFVQWV